MSSVGTNGWAGLRVCHLGKFYPPARGGFETHLRTLVQAQARLGAEVTVLCVNHRDRGGRDVTWDNLAHTPGTEEWDGPVRVVRVGRVASVARFDVCPGLPRELAPARQRHFDVLHLHVPNPTMLLALATARLRAPLVVTYQSDVIKQRALALAVLPFERLVFGRARLMLSSSPTYIDGSAHLRRYRSKVDVLPMGLDLSQYLEPSPTALAFRDRLTAEHGGPLWLSVGRLVYYKGLVNAIRALLDVPGKLVVVGTGPLRAELEAEANALGVGARIVWCGNLHDDEVVGAYHAATALWFPSNARSEGYGLVQVEAMASGCPVINTSIPHSGVAWVSQHEVSGLTVPVNDPVALAAAARRLLFEAGLRERLARQAVARCHAEFEDRVMGRRSLELYRTALAGGPHAAGPDTGNRERCQV
jgi:rhamnosyl/mannosyltransferase